LKIDRRFQTLVALVLSAQTKDEVTAAAMGRLHSRLQPFSAQRMRMAFAESEIKLGALLCPVGFYRRKAEYILKVRTLHTVN